MHTGCVSSQHLFYITSNVLKHCQSIQFKPGPTAATTHYLVRTYAGWGKRGGGKEKTTTPPVVIRFLCNSTAVNSRQRSSVKSITDRNRIIKPPLSSTWNVPPTRMKTIRLQHLHHFAHPPSFMVWGRDYSCHPVEEFKRGNTEET